MHNYANMASNEVDVGLHFRLGYIRCARDATQVS